MTPAAVRRSVIARASIAKNQSLVDEGFTCTLFARALGAPCGDIGLSRTFQSQPFGSRIGEVGDALTKW